MLGYAYYGQGHFEKSLNLWRNALHTLRKSKSNRRFVVAELLNNIGCVYFELGTETKAIKFMSDSILAQTQAISFVYKQATGSGGGERMRVTRHSLMKLATSRANIAYVYLRMKNADLAISQFEESLMDQHICLDPHHPLVLSIMDHLAISYLRKGSSKKCSIKDHKTNKDKAIQIYSKMLTAKIEADGAEHEECVAILTKLSILQWNVKMKGKDKAGIQSCMKKIQSSISNNGSCQKERFEKLLKVYKVPGLKTITIKKKFRKD